MFDKIKYDPKDLDKITTLISGRTILFAHQSVGSNLIDGINLIYSDANKPPPTIIHVEPDYTNPQPAFLHMRIGVNKHPLSKIHEFEKIINTNTFPTPDIAALKLCYVDVLGKESPSEIFDAYENMIARIKLKYPNLILLHFTMPLMSDTGLFHTINSLLKISASTISKENMLRNKYNRLLINKYGGNDFIFDIAQLESTTPIGEPCVSNYKDRQHPSMCRAYTSDGGHLNQLGQKRISEKLLFILAQISSIKSTAD